MNPELTYQAANRKFRSEISCHTISMQTFMVRSHKIVRVKICSGRSEPKGCLAYSLEYGGLAAEGETDGDGRLEEVVDLEARDACLRFEGKTFTLDLRSAPSIATVSGIQYRLKQLGFDCGTIDGKSGSKLTVALKFFQREYGCEVTGRLDEKTRSKLSEVSGNGSYTRVCDFSAGNPIRFRKGTFLFFPPEHREGFVEWLWGIEVARRIQTIQNHHTGGGTHSEYAKYGRSGALGTMEGLEDWHLLVAKNSGYRVEEIFQNFTTLVDGTIVVCRPLGTVPACIAGRNDGAIGIEHSGNFDLKGNVPVDTMTEAHRSAIILINAALCHRFNLRPQAGESIVYHHWYDRMSGEWVGDDGGTRSKSCPGATFFGGNKLADARKNFIPAIEKCLEENRTKWNGIRAGLKKALP